MSTIIRNRTAEFIPWIIAAIVAVGGGAQVTYLQHTVESNGEMMREQIEAIDDVKRILADQSVTPEQRTARIAEIVEPID